MGRLPLLAAAVAALMGFGSAAASNSAGALGLCSCCATSLAPSCSKVCTANSEAAGMCPAAVDYDSTGAAAEGANPLNGTSLKDLSLGNPTRWQLELFRRFVEKGRRQAIATYKVALRHLKRGKITEAEFARSKTIYDEALVNYYHGIRAYLDRVGTKSD